MGYVVPEKNGRCQTCLRSRGCDMMTGPVGSKKGKKKSISTLCLKSVNRQVPEQVPRQGIKDQTSRESRVHIRTTELIDTGGATSEY
jgi:hypothetical protein